MTIRVHISPVYDTPDAADGGIRRVTEAQVRYLPEFDVAVVRDPAQADVCAVHGTLHPPRRDVPLVVHNHGCYWSDYVWPSWAAHANAQLVANMARADAVTTPSQWVAQALSRGLLVAPEVIYHGVDAEAWEVRPDRGYVLWNKARADVVSDPRPVGRLAERLPDVPIVTTFGEGGPTVHVTGPMPAEAMRRLVSEAGVYLATTRETFGIGTLEALAAGVPVVGYAYGGQEEIVLPGETGELVAPGDDDALAAAVRRVLADRDRYSAAARADALARWGWRPRIAQYAALYRRVAESRRGPRVSVVITTHNLNAYLPEAYASARAQADEVIVVDDCGAEDARAALPADATVVRPPENLGLSGARNFGAGLTAGRYLLFLDADDALGDSAVTELADALDRDPDLHVAAGGLAVMTPAGDRPNPWPDGGVDAWAQLAHLNQLHYAAMWRRSAFERTGGYRARDWRAEDAALWCRALGGGLRIQQVTRRPTLRYRIRPDSKSQQEAKAHTDRDGDWTSWLPWRVGAATAQEGAALRARDVLPDPRRVPFGMPVPPGRLHWPIPHRQAPAASVVIPVGPGHAAAVVDALDSLTAQTCGLWEAVVVNDTGAPLVLPGHPWARVVDTAGATGAGAARNAGLDAVRAPWVLWLDADDVLRPEALETLLRAAATAEAAYLYCDTLVLTGDGRLADAAVAPWQDLPAYRNESPPPASVAPTPAYDQARWLDAGYAPGKPGLHSVTALVATAAARAVGGFDATLDALEDWEFYLRLAAAGFCGQRVAQPLLVYRLTTGRRRQIARRETARLMKQIARTYAPYTEGKQMAKSCCGGLYSAQLAAQQAQQAMDARVVVGPDGAPAAPVVRPATVRLRYVGPLQGEHVVMGRPSNIPYRVGANPFVRFVDVDARDLDYLLAMDGDEKFEVVQ